MLYLKTLRIRLPARKCNHNGKISDEPSTYTASDQSRTQKGGLLLVREPVNNSLIGQLLTLQHAAAPDSRQAFILEVYCRPKYGYRMDVAASILLCGGLFPFGLPKAG